MELSYDLAVWILLLECLEVSHGFLAQAGANEEQCGREVRPSRASELDLQALAGLSVKHQEAGFGFWWDGGGHFATDQLGGNLPTERYTARQGVRWLPDRSVQLFRARHHLQLGIGDEHSVVPCSRDRMPAQVRAIVADDGGHRGARRRAVTVRRGGGKQHLGRRSQVVPEPELREAATAHDLADIVGKLRRQVLETSNRVSADHERPVAIVQQDTGPSEPPPADRGHGERENRRHCDGSPPPWRRPRGRRVAQLRPEAA